MLYIALYNLIHLCRCLCICVCATAVRPHGNPPGRTLGPQGVGHPGDWTPLNRIRPMHWLLVATIATSSNALVTFVAMPLLLLASSY